MLVNTSDNFRRDMNLKIYTIVLDTQKLQSIIPPQIDRQQPVLFEDAHGRIAPFHVEFINCFEVDQLVPYLNII